MVDESLVIYHNGTPLLNGAFGVTKGKTVWSDESQAETEVLRLIINLTPSNQLQRPITGDVKSLPCPAQWCMLELDGTEHLVWSSEDMRCCFYIFNLPPRWLPYFILEKQIEGSGLGRPGEMLRLAVNVLPMGWLSAVGSAKAVTASCWSRTRLEVQVCHSKQN